MIKTRTYTRGASSVTISVDVHSGIKDFGRGKYLPVSTITYAIDAATPQVINDVVDAEIDTRLGALESALNAKIDGTILIQQLESNGYA